MPLNDITFAVQSGGLGRRTVNEDNTSCMMFAVAPPSSPTWPTNKFKEFRSIEEVVAAGITKGHATLGETYYQAKEFFRLAPGASLWLGLNATLPTYAEMLTATGGKVRQAGVYYSIATKATITSVHQAGVDSLTALHAPLVVVAALQNGNTAVTLGTLDDLAAASHPQVAVLICGDGSGEGKALATATSQLYIPALGATLGTIAKSKVSDNIGWVEKYNFSDGLEYDTIRMADGTDNPTDSALDGYNTKRYLVFRKHRGISGTYMADSFTGTAATNDLGNIESNRTLQKARRLVRASLLPDLNSPITVDATSGKIASGTVKYLESKGIRPMNQMQADAEISGFGVYIDPNQNVLSTSLVNVTVKLVTVGVARNLKVTIGLATSTQL